MSKLAHSNEESMNKIDEKRAARDGIEIRPITQEMVNRFLAWTLPIGFSPDCGIKFDGSGVPPNDYKDAAGYVRTWPVGTNLLTAEQAEQMLEHVAGPALRYEKMLLQSAERELESLRNAVGHCQCPACVGGNIHSSDCAVHNMPAYPNGPCNCPLSHP